MKYLGSTVLKYATYFKIHRTKLMNEQWKGQIHEKWVLQNLSDRYVGAYREILSIFVSNKMLKEKLLVSFSR
jgi:hypothetical protein